jgi:hypothetical protein
MKTELLGNYEWFFAISQYRRHAGLDPASRKSVDVASPGMTAGGAIMKRFIME